MKYISKDEQKLNKRYEKYIWDVSWTKRTEEAFKKLNFEILQMQSYVQQKMQAVSKEFYSLQNDFPFLKGFKVIGQIVFSPKILDDDSDEEIRKSWLEKQRKVYEFWDILSRYTNDKLWQLVFDSSNGDFTPYSKDLMCSDNWCGYLNGLGNGEKFSVASYLQSLVELNRTITYKDLQKCSIGDFYPFVFVTVNFDDKEIVNFRNYNDVVPEYIEELLLNRRSKHNHGFRWSEENIQKILEVNEAVSKKAAFMKSEMSRLHAKFKELGKVNPLFKEFDIDAEIQYQNKTHPTDVADLKMLKALQDSTKFYYYQLHCNEDTEKVTDLWHEHEDEDLNNWNFEVYREHFSEEQKQIPFNYFMHAIFIDDYTYSFEDLIRMREEDFVVCWDINVNNNMDEDNNVCSRN